MQRSVQLPPNMSRFPGILLSLLLSAAAGPHAVAAAPSSTDDHDFFESKIRPLLVDQCYSCHSANAEKGVKGGLRLDSREGWVKGGDTGPALVPGDPDRSLLIKAIRYADENLQMPPKGKRLTDEQVAALETWVKMGAPDPRSDSVTAAASASSTTSHWAFRPVQRPAEPAVRNRRWIRNPVDAFVLARLEERGMSPAPAATKRALIRRATYDLTGLPPTPADVANFLADTSPDAFEKVVDRLLNSPRYGERWARHWLDVARYADTKGYVFEEERRYAFSHTYRDYVIRALNEDLPFDRFIIEQLAADQLELGDDKRPLAAMGFLTLGRRFLNNRHDIIDDRIDVTTRGFMGLTVGCARCHDHKYDPIPMKDYYSLYGVFASSSEPSEKPLLGASALPPAYPEYLAEKRKREDELNSFRSKKQAELRTELRRRAGDYLLAAHDAAKLDDASKAEALARERKLDPPTVRRWSESLREWEKSPHPILAPWFAFASISEADFTHRAASLIAALAQPTDGTPPPNPAVLRTVAASPPASLKELADRYNQLFTEIDKSWDELLQSASSNPDKPAPTALADADREQVRQFLYAANAPANLTDDQLPRLYDVPTGQRVRALTRKLEELDATHPGAPPRGMVLVDEPNPRNPRLFVRGNPNNPGPEVPRQFLEILAGPDRKPFQKGSGRLEMAQAIASRDNPLTARVIVNRVWLQHFGAGLVRTPSDFGLRSDPPTHPELLDHLASHLVDTGWSLKQLHRLILLSNTYQQSSDGDPRYAQADPDNRLLWHMRRKRLDFESMRDTLLSVAGNLDLHGGGQAVDIVQEPFATRRTVYGFVERQNLPGLFRTFDFASPDTTSPQRFSTTVPQQALFLLNSPFIIHQARQLTRRVEAASDPTDAALVRRIHEEVLQRPPDREELALGLEYLAAQSGEPAELPDPPAWAYGLGEFDPQAGRIHSFTPLPHFTGKAWQGGPKLPDDQLGWVMLNASGGHPGADARHAAVRRWTAPHAGTLTLSGTLSHDAEAGDGVRGRIVSSRQGLLGEWTAHRAKTPTAPVPITVEKGEMIDLVVDCRENENSDGFEWPASLRLAPAAGSTAASWRQEWNAREDFAGPQKETTPLTPRERYAQVLLVSNELFFVD